MEKKERPRAAPTGRKYPGVKALMEGEGMSKDIQEKVSQLISDSRVSTQLAVLRHQANITQKVMAEKLGVQQGTISKLEAGLDDDLTLGIIKAYSRVIGERIALQFGRPLTHPEAVRQCANALKYRLDELAKIANQNVELQSEIKGFLSEAFCNLFNIIALCNGQLPIDENDIIEEIRMEVVSGKTAMPASCALPSNSESTKELVKV